MENFEKRYNKNIEVTKEEKISTVTSRERDDKISLEEIRKSVKKLNKN